MEDVGKKAMRKVRARFLPLLFICFVASFIDRVNVGFAALTMRTDLALSNAVFGLGAGLFFIGYVLFEVPSNVILERVGARLWMTRIMFTWGLLATATAFVHGMWSFYAIRFLLGLAEAGFFPGMIFFLTFWVPKAYRAHIVSTFMSAMPVALVVSGPISGYLLGLDGVFGLRGWQLMYIAEGLPSVILAGFTFWILRDNPAKAEWLAPDEKAWLENELTREKQREGPVVPHGFANIFRHPIILAVAAVYYGINCFNFGLTLFVPQIVREFHLSLQQTGFVSTIPFIVAAVGMIAWGKHSDRTGERRVHLVVPLALAALGIGGSTLVAIPVVKLALLCVAAFGVFSALPIFWSFVPSLMSPAAAAVGFAFVNSLGNLGGFSVSYAVGAIKDATGSFNGGLQLIGGYGCVAVVIMVLVIRHQQRAMAKHKIEARESTAG